MSRVDLRGQRAPIASDGVLHVAAAAVVMAALAGCDPTVDLVVDVRTDLTPGVEFDAARVTIEGGASDDRGVMLSDDFVGGQRVAFLSGLSPGTYRARVELLLDDSAVLGRPLVVEVRESTAVTVVLTRDCRGVECPGGGDPASTACLNGMCVAAECSETTPEGCDSVCDSAGDCDPPEVTCADARCTGTACLYEDNGSCGSGFYCALDTGCEPLPGVDAGAGLVDAGPVDAGPGDDAGTDAGPLQLDAGPPTGLALFDDDFSMTSFDPQWQFIELADLDVTHTGTELQLQPLDSDWWFESDTASLVYVDVPSNRFAVTVRVRVEDSTMPGMPPTQQWNLAGVMIRNPTTVPPAYVAGLVGRDDTGQLVENKNTTGGTSEIQPLYFGGEPDWAPGGAEIRLCYFEDTVRVLFRDPSDDTGDWVMGTDRVRTTDPLGTTPQVGLFVEGTPTPQIIASFDSIRFSEITILDACDGLP